ncbi:alpha/beta fold hydrolase [Sphingomonas sp. SUN019]|uniref:alpha/beta fold hydrolase n=1 Tax=Sphingomonas sp. SUN019 TaxID=2937788 RepID=UPI0021648567|nr:alpha/beta fold hydrolase [Sphingomonas sp. SUN019]UVO50497.1 alpha/beta fold hydrolase [Sphingomonas sp. SUN019]
MSVAGAPALKRRFLQVGNRRVHYFRAGDGPPAVLIHSSPANARLLMKEIDRLSRDHTVFAFDTPGFGLSDPLPMTEMVVADLADALAGTLSAIDMPRCPVFGTHTGAAIALEFGVRHPERTTGLVLDGVPAFTDAECERFFGTYFQKMPPSPLGGHYAEAWTRFRDQSIWFPWTNRTPEQLNPYDLGPPHSTHLWVQMFFEAAEHYAPAYRAASFYGARAIAAIAELTVPAVFTATETDMLYPHLDRFPPLKDGQAIAPIGTSFERKRKVAAEAFARYGADGLPPVDRDAIGSSGGIARQFMDGLTGQIHVRYAGDRSAPPLLLIHDAPGSSEQAEPLIAQLAERFFVVAPDLPGSGESDAFAEPPSVATLADAAAGVLDTLGIDRAAVYGIGFGSSVALALAHTGRATAAILQALALPDADERASLRAHYAPPIEIEADGAHWYRTWLMLRDSQVYWPWYDRRLPALRRVEADFSARPLHRWTMDVMRARQSYAHPIHAALDHDAAAALTALPTPLLLVRDPATPLSAQDDRLRALAPNAVAIDAASGFVEQLVRFVTAI